VLDAPWEEVVEPPSPRNAPVLDLVLAIEIAERAIAGEVDLGSLNRRSLARRAERASEAEIAAMIAEHGIIDGAEAEALATEAGLSAADLVARIRESGMAARAVRRGRRRDPLED
jgi:hypothetical protein